MLKYGWRIQLAQTYLRCTNCSRQALDSFLQRLALATPGGIQPQALQGLVGDDRFQPLGFKRKQSGPHQFRGVSRNIRELILKMTLEEQLVDLPR